MLKRRIIPILLLIDGRLVKTRGFDTYRDVGDPVQSAKVYNAQDADELVFLNINRQQRSIDPLLPLLEAVSAVSFMPLTFGGGISGLNDADVLIRRGADKVVVNSACYRNPALVTRIADKFGSQAVVVSIDVRKDDSTDGWGAYSNCGRTLEDVSLTAHLHAMVKAGAGEILINSIDRDGAMSGYDLPLVNKVVGEVPIPVIACGGAGNYDHLRAVFVETGAGALACGSLFNFGDSNPIRAKAFLTNYAIPFKVI